MAKETIRTRSYLDGKLTATGSIQRVVHRRKNGTAYIKEHRGKRDIVVDAVDGALAVEYRVTTVAVKTIGDVLGAF